MGFFADIIRDSRRGGMAAHAPEAPVSLGGKETPADAPAVAEKARVEPAAATGSDGSVNGFGGWGRSAVSVGESPLQSGAVTRRWWAFAFGTSTVAEFRGDG